MTVPQQSHGRVASERGSGLPENVAGALAYALGPITGILFFVIDRGRAFVRFHALQSIGLTVAWIPVWVGLVVLGTLLATVPFVGWLIDLLLGMAVGLTGFVLWLWLMYTAWSGGQWEVPIVGPQVRRISDGMAQGESRVQEP